MMKNLNNYVETFETVVAGLANSNCNSITILNISATALMLVNGVPVPPYNSFVSKGDYLDFNTTKYNIVFEPSDGTGAAVIIRKNYL